MPSGRCPVCGQEIAVRNDGGAQEHRAYGDVDVPCKGSGRPASTMSVAQARLSLLESAMISAEAAGNIHEIGAFLAEVYTIVGEFPELQLPSL